MERETNPPLGPFPPAAPRTPHKARIYAFIATALAVCLLALGVAIGVFQHLDRDGFAQDHAIKGEAANQDLLKQLKLFKGWGTPDIVLLLSGDQHGYLQPCGCSYPQYGGLTRRYNLLQALRQRGWPVVAADLGDLNQTPSLSFGPSSVVSPQMMLKYVYSMKALDLMSYAAVNFGEYETRMPLPVAMANYALNEQTPRVVSANLQGRQPGGLFNGMVFDSALADKHVGPRVGIFGLTGPSVEKKIKDPNVKFSANTQQILLESLKSLKKNQAELTLLLYQGDTKEATACAQFAAAAAQQDPTVPRLDVILCTSLTSEPPAQPLTVGNTTIVEVGHKGRYVGVLGGFQAKGKAGFTMQYELVSIGPELDTPAGKEKGHRLMELLEDYAQELKRSDYLSKFKQVAHPVQATFAGSEYVGSARCQSCHAEAYKVWEKSAHGTKAYDALVEAKNPSLRQFDGECIVCHTVGFGYKTGFENLEKTPHLLNVGCESCHGPASKHVEKPRDAQIHKEINPLKWRGAGKPTAAQENNRLLGIDMSCQKCHDLDNDNNFQFTAGWAKIVHMTPRNQPVINNATGK